LGPVAGPTEDTKEPGMDLAFGSFSHFARLTASYLLANTGNSKNGGDCPFPAFPRE